MWGKCGRGVEIFYRKTNKAPKLPIHTPLHLLRRYAIRLAEGVVEARGVFKAAAAGYNYKAAEPEVDTW